MSNIEEKILKQLNLHTRYFELNEENIELKKELKSSMKFEEREREEKFRLQKVCDELENKYLKLEEKHKKSAKMIAELKTIDEQRSVESLRTYTQYRKLLKNHENIKRENDELKTENEKLKDEDKVSFRIRELKKDRDDSWENYKNLFDECSELKKENEELKEELHYFKVANETLARLIKSWLTE